MKKQDAMLIEAPIPTESHDKRYIYNGDKREPMFRRNRPVKRRRRSPFNIILAIFLTSLFIVFYVWNKIGVDKLAVGVNQLQNQYQKTLNANAILRAEVDKKSSLERIEKIATEQIGLIHPKVQPVWFEMNDHGTAHEE